MLPRSSFNRLVRSKISVRTKYHAAHKQSINESNVFWNNAAKEIDWFHKYDKVAETSDIKHNKWFVNGKLNMTYNCVDRHVKNGLGEKDAIIYDSPVTNTIRKISYNELQREVIKAASVLTNLGVTKGDRVIIYMPNIPEASISMLACARIGAIHSVVFGGFAAPELAIRINDCKPKVIISASCGIDGSKVIDYKTLLDKAIELSAPIHAVKKCLVLQRDVKPASLVSGRDLDFTAEMNRPDLVLHEKCVPLLSTDPLYVLYTSGTTGNPKGVVRDTAGYAVALKWTMHNIYGLSQDSVWWAASDVGWVVGHSYGVYGPLLHGCTTVMYEGKSVGTPDASNFWRTIERHRINALFVAPTAMRAIKKEDDEGLLAQNFDLTSLKTIFLAGERADTNTIQWTEKCTKVPVRDNWWQTETGWPICANAIGLEGYIPTKYGSTYKACPGYNVQVLDGDNKVVPPNTMGNLAIKLPLPPGTLQSLYNNEKRFVESYLTTIPGYYDTGDAGYIDEDGYVYVMSRSDDVLNVAGHRLSSGAMEEIISDHHDVAEVAVIGVRDSFKGQLPLGLIVLNAHCTKSEEEVVKELIAMVRERIGAVACFKDAVAVDRLPKTRSGKVLRATMRSIANGEAYKIPATIEDVSVLEDVERIIKKFEKLD